MNLRKKEFKTYRKMIHVKTKKINRIGKNVQRPNAWRDTQNRNANDLLLIAIMKGHKPMKMLKHQTIKHCKPIKEKLIA